MANDSNIGKIGWFDLTVDDAAAIRDFYSKVVGRQAERVGMGDARFCVIEDPNGAVAALHQPG